MADTKLPTWANNDLATYSAFTGLPEDLTSTVPKKIDPQSLDAKGNPKGMQFIPGSDDSGEAGTFKVPINTPSGWDPKVKVFANYDSAGNLTNFTGSDPVFPADANGKLNKQSKFNPIWDASGKAAPVQNTTKGGWEGTPIAMAAASMIPGVAPVMAGLNAANSLAHGKFDVSTVLNGLTAATGFGGNLGFSADTMSGLNTAKNAVSGINALKTGNLAGLASSLNSFADVLPAGSVEATRILGGIASLKKGDTAGALSALASLTGSPDIKIASQASSFIKSMMPQSSSAQPTVGFGQTAKQPDKTTAGTGQTAPAATASNNGVAGLQSGQTLVHPLMAKTKSLKSIFGEDNPYEGNNPYEGEQMYTGGSVGLPSLLRS
jgi:hypothetical protein